MSGILRSKLFAYGVVSTGIAVALVSHVYNQRQNFYSAAVQMHRSTGSAIVSRSILVLAVKGGSVRADRVMGMTWNFGVL